MKLIFVDIDGTLTLPGGTVPPSSAVRAIQRARAAGNRVFLCTGRNPAMLRPLLAYDFDGYVACAGGYVLCGDKVLFDCPMSRPLYEQAVGLLRSNGVLVNVETKNGSYCDRGVYDFLSRISGGNSELLRWRRALEEKLHVLPAEEYNGDPVYKLIFYCDNEEQLRPARAVLDAEFRFVAQDVFGYGGINGELINRRFDKGLGVRLVAEELGVPLSDTVGFGDSPNDRELIETVGMGVCMANGSEELKARAGLVCPAVEEDGLAWAFERLSLF